MNTSVIIECMNDPFITVTIDDYKQYFDNIYILVPNDCSDTIVQSITNKDAKVIVANELMNTKNKLLNHAFDIIDSDYVIFVEGDGSYTAYDSHMLYTYISTHDYDMVVGNRFGSKHTKPKQKLYDTINRFASKKASNKYCKYIPDILSDHFVLRNTFYKNIKLSQSDNTSYTTAQLVKMCGNNFVFMDISYDEISSKKMTVKKGWQLIKNI